MLSITTVFFCPARIILEYKLEFYDRFRQNIFLEYSREFYDENLEFRILHQKKRLVSEKILELLRILENSPEFNEYIDIPPRISTEFLPIFIEFLWFLNEMNGLES